jgi:hypothetical protein
MLNTEYIDIGFPAKSSTFSYRRRSPSLGDLINCFDPDEHFFSLVESEW